MLPPPWGVKLTLWTVEQAVRNSHANYTVNIIMPNRYIVDCTFGTLDFWICKKREEIKQYVIKKASLSREQIRESAALNPIE